MRVGSFHWDSSNTVHIARHRVSTVEAEHVLRSSRKHVRRARREAYVAYGRTADGRYLVVVFRAMEAGVIRVVTARDMEEREKAAYRKVVGSSEEDQDS